MSETLGPRWHYIGDSRWQHEETGRIVGPLISSAPNWYEACEIEYAARMDAEAEVTRLRAALAEKDAEIARLERELAALLQHGIGVAGRRD